MRTRSQPLFNLLRMSVLAVCFANAALALAVADTEFLQAEELYESGEYEKALPLLRQAVEREPENSHYHHMLGKCYGRLAEHGSWLTALRYVNKTLSQFKKAVELNGTNEQALRDLEEFYLRAPAFLGGSRKKAGEIRKRLEQLQRDTKGASSATEP